MYTCVFRNYILEKPATNTVDYSKFHPFVIRSTTHTIKTYVYSCVHQMYFVYLFINNLLYNLVEISLVLTIIELLFEIEIDT